MLTRRFRKSDTDALDTLINHNRDGDVRLDRDVIVVSGEPVVGTLVWRPCMLVHEFMVGVGLSRRHTAASLIDFAVADATARPFFVHDALFLVAPENEAMLRFARSLRGVREDTGKVFHLDLEAQ